jgi:AraC-like DNA-binding protein
MKGGENLMKTWAELAKEANYSIAALASLCGVSVRQLERNFKQTMDQSPKQWLNGLRLESAREMLRAGGSVKEAALSSGYRYPQHFSRDFRKLFGVSPSLANAVQPIAPSKRARGDKSETD